MVKSTHFNITYGHGTVHVLGESVFKWLCWLCFEQKTNPCNVAPAKLALLLTLCCVCYYYYLLYHTHTKKLLRVLNLSWLENIKTKCMCYLAWALCYWNATLFLDNLYSTCLLSNLWDWNGLGTLSASWMFRVVYMSVLLQLCMWGFVSWTCNRMAAFDYPTDRFIAHQLVAQWDSVYCVLMKHMDGVHSVFHQSKSVKATLPV